MTHKQSAALSVRHLGVRLVGDGRKAVQIVEDVSFSLARGKVLGLVGESGAGKSMIGLSLLGLLPAAARVDGTATLADGTELLGATPQQLRAVRGHAVSTVFQEPMHSFNPSYTVGWQLREAVRFQSHGRRDRRHEQARVAELLQQVDLNDVRRIARSYPHELSGGQLQRAMIAMALAGDPQILIADEPTTALDVTVQAGVLRLLRRLVNSEGLALLLITHDMGVIAGVADDVMVLRHGRTVESAPVNDLFGHPASDYAAQLLAAVPSIEKAGGARGSVVDGDSPKSAYKGKAEAKVVAELRDVSIQYAKQPSPAVSSASFAIHSGESLGLVGESGSGKSTLGRALAGLVPISRGSVFLNGKDLVHAPKRVLRDIRQSLGFVFQDPASSLDPRHTVGWSIAEPLSVASGGDRRRHTARRTYETGSIVRELLTAVQLPASMAERFPHELSGGQRQRVAIARALVLNPAIIVADEPTSALDVSVQQEILALLHRLQAERGFGCLFISHDLAVVREVCSRVVVLQHGHVVEAGMSEDVLEHPQAAYTQELLASIPLLDPVKARERFVEA